MLRRMYMRTALLLVLPLLASCGGEAVQAPTAAVQPSATASASPVADALCAEAAVGWGGVVAAAFPAEVEDVRAFMADPHGADADPTAPRPAGDYDYPDGWDALPPQHQAAACYLDGPVPKGPPPALDGSVQPAFDRRFVIAAEGVPSFMVSAGPQANMPLSPLGEKRG